MKIGIFSNSESINQGGGVTYILGIASALAQENEVDLFFQKAVEPASISNLLPDYGKLPKIRQEPFWPNIRLVGELRRAFYDRNYETIIIQSPYTPRLSLAVKSYLVCEFPFTERPAWDDRVRLMSFNQIVANSKYTAHWIKRRWGKDANVLHPPVVPIAPLDKKPIILGVGRFVDGGRSKRQLELVEMFRQLCKKGLTGWELHLAGFGQSEQYVSRVKEACHGLPVHLHLNSTRGALEKLYGEAAIFWHAVGAGIDPEEQPQRMEHFGIATVEAMSAGCVPVVINRGGQTEIVSDSGAGLLWETFDECVELTWGIANDSAKMAQYSEQAIARADRFTYAHFRDQVRRLFEIEPIFS